MSIKPLPEDVIRRIRSSATVTSLNGAVCGLVKNSFDAGATRIDITVDYSRGNCTVEDDGLGILPLEFREAGGLGKLYRRWPAALLLRIARRIASADAFLDTSRHSPENETHGANGNFLASLAALSLLSVTSHRHLHNSQNSLTIRNSNVLARNLPALPEQRLVTFAHGTRVIVRDLFGSMAVRVKQRATAAEKAAAEKTWGRLVHDVTALLLAWPSPVALVVRDTLHNNETRFKPNARGRTDLLSRSSLVLAQSGLVDGLDYLSWIPVGASVGNLTIDGCISLNPVATRRAQFISLGIHPVANEHGTNVLYSEVNRVFINSGFAIEEGASTYRDQDAILSNPGGTADRVSRPKRGLDRWPMFSIRISSSSRSWPTLTSSFEDLLEDRSRTPSDMIDLLKLVCYEFLKKHHLDPRKVTTSLRAPSSRGGVKDDPDIEPAKKNGKRSKPASLAPSRSSSATPVSRPDSPFDLWQRVKFGRFSAGTTKSGSSTPELTLSARDGRNPPSVQHSRDSTPPPSLRCLDESGNVLRRPFEDLPSPSPPSTTNEEARCKPVSISGLNGKQTVEDEIPRTATPREDRASRQRSVDLVKLRNSTNVELASSFQPFKQNIAQPKKEPSDWLKGVLAKWQDPVFEPGELSVPRVHDASFSGPGKEVASAATADNTGCCHGTRSSNITLTGRISKAALMGAKVVAQVDRKFILIRLARDQVAGTKRPELQENSVLVLIDQHAADERCRLEALMQDYFEKDDKSGNVVARTERLDQTLTFEFSNKECGLLCAYADQLRRWGIFYHVEEPEPNKWQHESKQLSMVEVVGLPPSILQRCRTEPKIVANLLRSEIWKLEEEGRPIVRPFALNSAGSGHDIDWVSNFQGCPQGILDLLNSRSCRSAIMFNDVLSKDECEALVHRLGRCSFPFQCAHGRPSMAPLVDMRSLNTNPKTQLGSFGSCLKESGMMQ